LKIRLLDILACPEDKTWPLILHEFEYREIEDAKYPQKDEMTDLVCRYYCGKHQKVLLDEKKKIKTKDAEKISYEKDCKECLSKEIIDGIIECTHCHNYYPIIDEIPMMLKAELRNEDIEREFTTKWSEKIKEFLSKKE